MNGGRERQSPQHRRDVAVRSSLAVLAGLAAAAMAVLGPLHPIALAALCALLAVFVALLWSARARAAPPPVVVSASPPFDRTEALQRCDGSAELLEKILASLEHEGVTQTAELDDAIAQGDAPRVSRTAHRLKGSLMCIAAGPAEAATLALEHSGRAGDLSMAKAQLATLRAELARLYPALRNG
jgi:HPt (histidine-containing phosphotransfer) domain-containing protein